MTQPKGLKLHNNSDTLLNCKGIYMISNYFSLILILIFFSYRYLLDLNRSSDEAPDPKKEASVDQWVEWESTSLQVS